MRIILAVLFLSLLTACNSPDVNKKHINARPGNEGYVYYNTPNGPHVLYRRKNKNVKPVHIKTEQEIHTDLDKVSKRIDRESMRVETNLKNAKTPEDKKKLALQLKVLDYQQKRIADMGQHMEAMKRVAASQAHWEQTNLEREIQSPRPSIGHPPRSIKSSHPHH